jgi:ubiquinone/menaquinone biosynthesis C-methylase UbiE
MDSAEVGRYWENNAEAWTQQVRAGYDVYRDALNTPAFLAMLPPVDGLIGIDIGCGEGANTRQLAGLGARMTGIDIAPTFVRHAREAEVAEPMGIAYEHADASALPFANGSFDFATAFMSMMDVPDASAAMKEAARVVRPRGFFQFSILHPCFVPPYRRNVRDQHGEPIAVHVARYFDGVDGEIETWHFSAATAEERGRHAPFRMPRFHKTLSQWVELIVDAGFTIEKVGEPRADVELAAAEPHVADTRVAPIFLHFRLRNPGGSDAREHAVAE